jgi:5-methylcytosine-specific restriction enzyme subunit McrC
VESITLIEHEKIPIVQERTKGQKALSALHAAALDKLEKQLPPQTFYRGHRFIKFSQYCGIISLGNLTLEILPKIYGETIEPDACRKTLIKMLVKTRRLKTYQGGSANIALHKHALMDVFIISFCHQLHTELIQGMIHNYIEQSENLNVLRGRLRVEQQFKQNLSHKERLFCQYDILSANNPHNQVIKYVLKLMLKIPTGAMAKKLLSELLMRFADISDVKVDLLMIDSLTFNRTSCRYKPIFQQCRWFLQGLHPDVLVGNAHCITLLFDMNRLFEAYVGNVYKKLAWADGKRMREQGPKRYMVIREDRNEQLFIMKPDMVFLDLDNNIESIADAKWKLLDDREKKLGISQSDLYQMATYAMRYGVNCLALVYPKQRWLQEAIELKLQGSNSSLRVIPFDVSSRSGSEKMPWYDN